MYDMARNAFGTDVTNRTGSMNKHLGGMTFLKNGVMRVRVNPTNPQTPLQQELRSAFLFLTAAWNALTDAQRTLWATARGETYYLKQDSFTGVSRPYAAPKDLFVAMNLNYLVGDGSLNAPAVNFAAPGVAGALDVIGITSVVADASAGTIAVTFTGATLGEALVFSATPPVSPGNMSFKSVESKMRTVTVGLPVSPWAVGADYVALFGAITGATGKKIFWEVKAVELGTGKARVVNRGVTIVVA